MFKNTYIQIMDANKEFMSDVLLPLFALFMSAGSVVLVLIFVSFIPYLVINTIFKTKLFRNTWHKMPFLMHGFGESKGMKIFSGGTASDALGNFNKFLRVYQPFIKRMVLIETTHENRILANCGIKLALTHMTAEITFKKGVTEEEIIFLLNVPVAKYESWNELHGFDEPILPADEIAENEHLKRELLLANNVPARISTHLNQLEKTS